MKNQSKKGKSGLDVMFVLNALLMGIFGSLLLLVSYIVLEFSWLGSIAYDEGLKSIYFFQLVALAFLIPVFTGALAVLALAPRIKRSTYAIIAGMLSGVLAGIGFTAVFLLFIAAVSASWDALAGWQAVHDSVFNDLAGTMAGQISNMPYLLPAMGLLSIMLSAVGGSVFYTLSFYSRAKRSRAPGISGQSNGKIIAAIAAMLLLLAIVPPALAFAGIHTGLVEMHKFHDPVTVQRLSGDALMFTNNGGDSLGALDPSSHFTIYIGGPLIGYDMSNQTAARWMNVTMDPGEGLGVLPGSALTIKGKGISDLSRMNASTDNPVTHVYVVANTTDGRQLVFLNASV